MLRAVVMCLVVVGLVVASPGMCGKVAPVAGCKMPGGVDVKGDGLRVEGATERGEDNGGGEVPAIGDPWDPDWDQGYPGDATKRGQGPSAGQWFQLANALMRMFFEEPQWNWDVGAGD